MKLTRWLRPVHRKFREEKINLFFRALCPTPTDTLLDVGGGAGIIGEFLDLYSYFRKVTILNIHQMQIDATEGDTMIELIVGDGCSMPFMQQSFDFVFSNAVIEHVGSWRSQKVFADEINRVAKKGYFVTTPNKNFPIEPHTLLPFYQFMPTGIQRALVKISPGYLTRYEPIRLLSSRELQMLFPNARVVKIGLPLLHNNLVAFCRR